MTPGRSIAVALVATLSIITFLLHATVVRPRLFPAGAGIALSGDAVFNELSEQELVGFAHLPDIRSVLGQPVMVTAVWPGGEADRAGVRPGAQVLAITDQNGERLDLSEGLPADAAATIATWVHMYRMPPSGSITLTLREQGASAPRDVTVERLPVWSLDANTLFAWFWQFHGWALAKHLVYTLAALLVVGLGARGVTATLITLAFLLMGATDDGALFGEEWRIPLLAPALVTFSWTLMAVSFPVISLAILYFPTKAPVLQRQPWLRYATWLIAVPLGSVGVATTARLLGMDAATPAVVWFATHPLFFNGLFALGLTTNLGFLAYAVQRYRSNPDAVERRRIQTVLVTAVPGMLAYMLITAVPLIARGLGSDLRWPWPIAALLEFLVMLSALGMAYAVAVRRAMSPRTALRQGIQYALARKTLRILTGAAGAPAGRRARPAERPAALGHHPGAASLLHRNAGDGRARAPLSGRGAALARSPVLPLRVRRSRDPAVAGQPRSARDRSARADRAGPRRHRISAAPGLNRGARREQRRLRGGRGA